MARDRATAVLDKDASRHRARNARSVHLNMRSLAVLVLLLALGNQMTAVAQRRPHSPGGDATEQAQMEIPYTFDTFDSPTLAPSASDGPSLGPSSMPSSVPRVEVDSEMPTSFPTISPVRTKRPSAPPTELPSPSPSTLPTELPSASPTELPSSSPSALPSALPTLTCHDMASYRSPLNNFTCQDHANTDCTSWRFVGLNITQLTELVESCPVTCGIPCGYFSELDMNVSFVISNVPGLIDDFETRPPLETTTQEYLTGYILKSSPITSFAFTRVDLLRQDILNASVTPPMNISTRALHGLRQTRQLNETMTTMQDYINLKVILNLQGFQIYPIRIVLTDLLIEAVDSPDYTIELRRSHSFYANATASSAAQAMPSAAQDEPDVPVATDQRTVSPVKVALITVVVVSVVFSGAILYRKHLRVLRTKRDTPANMETPPYSTGSQRANVFSFDLSPQGSTVGRLLAVLSGESGQSTTSPSSSEETSASSQPMKAVVEDHPFTGLIPPMLIIDNIELEKQTDPNTSLRHIPETAVVPTKRMEASGSFIEALNNRHEPGSSSTLSHLLQNVSSVESGAHEMGSKVMPLENRALDVILSGDGHVNDDSSVCSTPVHSSEMDVDVQLRRALSSGQLDGGTDANEMIDRLAESNWDGKDESSSAHALHVSVSYDQPPERSHELDGSLPRSNSWNKQSFLGSPSKESFKKSLASTPSEGPRGQFQRVNDQTSRMSSRGLDPSPPHVRNDSSSSHKRNHSSPSRRSSLSRKTNSSSDVFAPQSECLYIYEASHRGYLGLSIEPSPTGGARIRAVKDYSPLYGLVVEGDRIVAVDEVETMHKTTAGVAELLRRRKGRNRKVRITVARTVVFDTGGIPALPISKKRTRSKSIGSMKVPSNSSSGHYHAFHEPSSHFTELDKSFADLPTPGSDEASAATETPEESFHFLGAVASECEVEVSSPASPVNLY